MQWRSFTSENVQMVNEPLGGFEDMCIVAPGEYFTIAAYHVEDVVHIRPFTSVCLLSDR